MDRITAKTVFIINPRAASGEAGEKWPEISRLAEKFFSSSQLLLTEGPGSAEILAARAAEAGVEKVICVGGDGTMNEVVNGLLSVPDPGKRPALGCLPFGTGCDLARTFNFSRNIEEGLRNIADRGAAWSDVGKAIFQDHNGHTVSRYFHNILSFGLGGEVAARTNRSSKRLGGYLSFLLATLSSVFSYRKPRVRLKVDADPEKQYTCLQVAVANGRWHGGGMLVAPDAEPDDGVFTLTIIGDLTIPEIVWNLPKLYNGMIYSVNKVSHMSVKHIEASSDEKVMIELDGEQPGFLPLSVDIVARALRIIV